MIRSGFRAFAEADLGEYLSDRLALISGTIKNEKDDFILNVSQVEYQQHLVERFSIEPPVLLIHNLSMDEEERMIRAEDFPPGYHVREGRSYPRTAYILHIPVSGEAHLLKYQPSQRLVWSHRVNLRGDDDLYFDIVPFTDDAVQIRREIDSIVNSLQTQLNYLCADVNAYNMNLPIEVQKRFEARKTEILKQRSVRTGIGIPLRKVSDAPKTFSVPSPPVPKKITPKPPAHVTPNEPEPTLATDDYQAILRVINDLGTALERHPSTYEDKDEESLRDYLLLLLQPQFEGSATGETFNKAGKTDILLRYQNHNVFIAECKFWAGIKSLFGAITQLLGYLTWRDSKAALVLFVRNKGFTEVLTKVDEEMASHPQYARLVSQKEEGWTEYRFTLPDDETREVTLTILAFHLP